MEATLDMEWDLSDLYASVQDPKLGQDQQNALRLAQDLQLQHAQGIATLNAPGLADLLRRYEAILELNVRAVQYVSLAFSANTQDDNIKQVRDQVLQASAKIRNLMLFVALEIRQAPQTAFDGWVAADELADLRHWLLRTRAYAEHTLSEKEERILNLKALSGVSAWSQFYTEFTGRLSFEVEGQSLSDPETRTLLRSDNPATREAAYQALYGTYAAETPTFSHIFNTVFQDRLTDQELRGYQHPLAQTALDDELTPGLIEQLIEVSEAHYPLVERFMKLKARRLGHTALPSAHRLAPWGDTPHLSYEQAKDLTLQALDRFSPQFGHIAREFFDRRWIDVWPRKGKRGGAFCSGGLPANHPYILLNHAPDLDSAHTLAHEMGHGIHFYLARQQRLLNFGATTPMAETASVFAEVLLDDLLLQNLNSPQERATLLASKIEDAVNTAFRQIMYTRWELLANQARKQGALPAAAFNDLWQEQVKRLYGQGLQYTPLDWSAWSTIPHFINYRYYCYSYAYGFLLVLGLYRRYQELGQAFVPGLTNMLAAGASQSPQQIMAMGGIDASAPGFWEGSFAVVEQWINELESIQE